MGTTGRTDKPKIDPGTKVLTQSRVPGTHGKHKHHAEVPVRSFFENASSRVGHFAGDTWKLLHGMFPKVGDYHIILKATLRGDIDPSTWLKEREERRAVLIGAQDEAFRLYPQSANKDTHCSEGALYIAVKTGAPYVDVLAKAKAQGTGDGLAAWVSQSFYNANEQAERLSASLEYVRVTPQGGQWLANCGVPVFVAQKNPQGHGHIATIRPITHREFISAHGLSGRLLANVGKEFYGQKNPYRGQGVLRESAVFAADKKSGILKGADGEVISYAPIDIAAEAIRGVAAAMRHGDYENKSFQPPRQQKQT